MSDVWQTTIQTTRYGQLAAWVTEFDNGYVATIDHTATTVKVPPVQLSRMLAKTPEEALGRLVAVLD
jgi:hypothetical protein